MSAVRGKADIAAMTGSSSDPGLQDRLRHLPPALDSSFMVRASLAGPCPMTNRADDVEVTYLTEKPVYIA
jgi:hypothetical protein